MGHELVYNVNPEEITKQTMHFLKMFTVHEKEKNYVVEENVEMYNKNSGTHMRNDLEDVVINRIEDQIELKEDKKEEIVNEIEMKKEEIKTIDSSISELIEIKKKLQIYSDRQLRDLCIKFKLPHSGLKAKKHSRIETYIKAELNEKNYEKESGYNEDCNECVSKPIKKEISDTDLNALREESNDGGKPLAYNRRRRREIDTENNVKEDDGYLE